jgi:hypothetical protein
MKPLTAAVHFLVLAGIHRVDAGRRQNDQVPVWRQSNLELLEENKILKF